MPFMQLSAVRRDMFNSLQREVTDLVLDSLRKYSALSSDRISFAPTLVLGSLLFRILRIVFCVQISLASSFFSFMNCSFASKYSSAVSMVLFVLVIEDILQRINARHWS